MNRAPILFLFLILCVLWLKKTTVTGENSERQYHHCSSKLIPYISAPLETAAYLLYSNSSFIRFGDSEVLFILHGSEPFQQYHPSLGNALTRAFLDEDPNIMVGLYDCFSGFPRWRPQAVDWWHREQKHYYQWVMDHYNPERQYFSAMLSSIYVHTYGTKCALLDKIYHTLRSIWKGKDIVILKGDNGQVYKYDVYDTARSQTVYIVPRYQAWNAYDEAKEKLFKHKKDILFILTAGPLSRVLAYDLAKTNRRALDLGHLAKDYDLYMKQQEPIPHVFYERDEESSPQTNSSFVYKL